uniref:Uncharacterized protein n=1 Tax=Amphiprion ocellaris TaxID=80972 RepID=A0A3Q1CRG6_AMPOC
WLALSPTLNGFYNGSKLNVFVSLSDMSAASNLRSNDQFLCSICLDVFTNPVSTSCGHNFCKDCITKQWDNMDSCQCPKCKEVFKTRPVLQVNTSISESVQQAAKPGEVPCDVCTGIQRKALKSCLPHLTKLGLRKHQLMEPVEKLEGRMCLKHYKPLALFCQTDHTCVCVFCSVLDHKTHEFVPLKTEYEEQKAKLVKTEVEIQQMIQKRRLKIFEIRESLKISTDAVDRQNAESVQIFTALQECVEKYLSQLIEELEEQQKTAEKQAEDAIKHLEKQISELMKRSSEVEQLSSSEEHLHFLQSFWTLKAALPTDDWMEICVRPPSYERTVERAVSQLEEMLTENMKKTKLKQIKKFAVDVTLDPGTAHPNLILTDDGKQVKVGDVWKNLPDSPQRFFSAPCVLGKQSFSSGRFYFEVLVKGKTCWTLGVVRESINRKGGIKVSPRHGYWTVVLRNGNEYKAGDGPSVCLHLRSGPEKVGVFVDYEEGLVSIYDADTAVLIFSFTGCFFTEKLHPYFCPCLNDRGKNSAPLIICPVSQTERTKH